MKIKKILALSSAAVLLSACAADENFESLKRSDYAKPISFNVTESSRADLVDINSLHNYGFYVYANVKDGGTGIVSTLMDGVKISYDLTGSKWGYAPLVYWPAGDDKILDFYPVYAYDDPNVILTTNVWDKKPHARYNVNKDVLKQTDYLWAAPLTGVTSKTKIGTTDKTYAQDGINFTFMHPLSGVSISLDNDDITYVDGGGTPYANMKEALTALKPLAGATYDKDYIHSFEITGAFPQFADVNVDAQNLSEVWDFTQSTAEVTTYTLLYADGATEASTDCAIYKNAEGDYHVTKNGKLAVLPCGSLPVTVTINHVVECVNGDVYLIKASANTVFKFEAGRWVVYDIKYNVPTYIATSMSKLDTKPTIGIAIGTEKADGMHAKKQ